MAVQRGSLLEEDFVRSCDCVSLRASSSAALAFNFSEPTDGGIHCEGSSAR